MKFRRQLPVYDMDSIERTFLKDLMIKPFDQYVHEHYDHLHRPHRHSFFHLVLFTAGKGSFTIDFDRFPVKPWTIYFMTPGQAHSWHFEGEVQGYIVHFNEVLFTDFLKDQDHLQSYSFFNGVAKDGVCILPNAIRRHVEGIFESLLKEIRLISQIHIDQVRIKLMELFIAVERQNENAGKLKKPQKPALIRAYQQLINQHFRQMNLPKDYSVLLNVTANHLNAICREMIGKTAGELIRERIMLEAKRLLTNADMTITEIAYDLNFKDNSYFNRFFKKDAGITPEQFRQKFIKT